MPGTASTPKQKDQVKEQEPEKETSSRPPPGTAPRESTFPRRDESDVVLPVSQWYEYT
jgi:hypothetical protein